VSGDRLRGEAYMARVVELVTLAAQAVGSSVVHRAAQHQNEFITMSSALLLSAPWQCCA
jgi:hypothetical protein